MKWRGKKLTALLAATCLCLSTPLSAAAATGESVSIMENAGTETEAKEYTKPADGVQTETKDEEYTESADDVQTEATDYGYTEAKLDAMTDLASSGWVEVDNKSNLVKYSGKWEVETGDAHIGGDAKQSNAPGAWAEITFTGTGIRWIGQKIPITGSEALPGQERNCQSKCCRDSGNEGRPLYASWHSVWRTYLPCGSSRPGDSVSELY